MSIDTIIATLAIGGGALFIGQFLPPYLPPELESYGVLLACVLWAALVLRIWKRWQDNQP
jgi:hypothetical protein